METPDGTYLFLKYDFPPFYKVWRNFFPPVRVYNRIITWDYFYLYLFIVFSIVILSLHFINIPRTVSPMLQNTYEG